jgi:hypothetical protein
MGNFFLKKITLCVPKAMAARTGTEWIEAPCISEAEICLREMAQTSWKQGSPDRVCRARPRARCRCRQAGGLCKSVSREYFTVSRRVHLMPVTGTAVKMAKRTRRDIEMSISLLLAMACLNTRQCLYMTYAAHPNTSIAVNLSKPDQMILN